MGSPAPSSRDCALLHAHPSLAVEAKAFFLAAAFSSTSAVPSAYKMVVVVVVVVTST